MANEVGAPMKRRDFLLSIISSCSSHEAFGRTSLQKVSYLSSVRFNRDLEHRAYYYGPFSSVVEQDTEVLLLSDYVRETIEMLPFVAKNGIQGRRYRYEVTESGIERLEAIKNTHNDEVKMIAAFADELSVLSDGLQQRVLASAAKTLFVAREQGRLLTDEEIPILARSLGWELSSTEVARVSSILETLQLN